MFLKSHSSQTLGSFHILPSRLTGWEGAVSDSPVLLVVAYYEHCAYSSPPSPYFIAPCFLLTSSSPSSTTTLPSSTLLDCHLP